MGDEVGLVGVGVDGFSGTGRGNVVDSHRGSEKQAPRQPTDSERHASSRCAAPEPIA